jgi:hypothetical protein
MSATVRVVLIKSGLPTVEEGRARLQAELDRARADGMVVLKLIHGYGSSGVGGSLRRGLRASLRQRHKEGRIRAFLPGEQWDLFNEVARELLQACPELASDQDLGRYNEGITLVLL